MKYIAKKLKKKRLIEIPIAQKNKYGEEWWWYCWTCKYLFGPGEVVLTSGRDENIENLYCPRHWFDKHALSCGTLKNFQEKYALIPK